MNNFFEDLKKYLEETPKEKIFSVWEKSAGMDSVGVSVEKFLVNSYSYHPIFSNSPNIDCIEYLNNNLKPEVVFGFFYIN